MLSDGDVSEYLPQSRCSRYSLLLGDSITVLGMLLPFDMWHGPAKLEPASLERVRQEVGTLDDPLHL